MKIFAPLFFVLSLVVSCAATKPNPSDVWKCAPHDVECTPEEGNGCCPTTMVCHFTQQYGAECAAGGITYSGSSTSVKQTPKSFR